MNLEDFRKTLKDAAPPSVSPLLQALWHDARGNWDEAHRITQDIETADAAWVHAYLHRKEGDVTNARYWYRRADRPEATATLESEWAQIVSGLLIPSP